MFTEYLGGIQQQTGNPKKEKQKTKSADPTGTAFLFTERTFLILLH